MARTSWLIYSELEPPRSLYSASTLSDDFVLTALADHQIAPRTADESKGANTMFSADDVAQGQHGTSPTGVNSLSPAEVYAKPYKISGELLSVAIPSRSAC